MALAYAPTLLTRPSIARREAAAPRVRPRWWVELPLLALCYIGYERARAADPVRPDLSFSHAHAIAHAEAALSLNIEPWLNRLFAAHDWLADLSGYYYATLHLAVCGAALAWLYVFHPTGYRRWRRTLVVASAAALLIFWAFPVAPPRLSVNGMTDILVSHDIYGVAHASTSGGFINIYAAMPSLHVGWAVWVAASMSDAYSSHRWRHVFWLYPLTTTMVVVGTANHFVFDALAGASLVLLASVAVRRVDAALVSTRIKTVVASWTSRRRRRSSVPAALYRSN